MPFTIYQLITIICGVPYHLHWNKKSYIQAVPIFVLKYEKGNVTLLVRLKWWLIMHMRAFSMYLAIFQNKNGPSQNLDIIGIKTDCVIVKSQ